MSFFNIFCPSLMTTDTIHLIFIDWTQSWTVLMIPPRSRPPPRPPQFQRPGQLSMFLDSVVSESRAKAAGR